VPDDLSQTMLKSAFDGAGLVYFDGMSTETALFVAREVIIIALVLASLPRLLDDFLRHSYW
jgi:hypothetical protein